jgi:uncharacterized membrane protein YdbT with pleckstrin-like domain
MDAMQTFRPKKSSFLFQRISLASVFWTTAAAAGSYAMWRNGIEPLAAPVCVALIFIARTAFVAFIAFRKEHYEVHDRHIVARSGGLFSDQVTELEFSNITTVKQRLPWIRYRIFDVGDVIVQSAGSSLSQVVFRSVRDPDHIYRMLQDQLRDNGYSMRRGELLHEEQPDLVGTALDVGGFGLAVLASILLPLTAAILDMTDTEPTQLLHPMKGTNWFTILSIIAVGSSLTSMVLRFLDLRNRTYQVFDDVVVYTEGFLNRSNAVIPYENIADANTAQTMIDQIFGLYDVKISCQGSAAEIRFRRLRRGKQLKAQISRLVAAAEATKRAKHTEVAVEKAAAKPEDGAAPVRSALPPVPAGEAWTADFRPNALREVAGLLWLLPVFPIFLGLAVLVWISASARRYTVGQNSARTRAGIFNVTETDFAYDKVTGAVVKRNPIDRLMGTVTVELWSIGSPRPLTLSSVNEQDIRIDALLRQTGIARTPIARVIPTRFTMGVWLRISLPLFFALGVVIAAITVSAVLGDVPELFFLAAAILVSPLFYYVYRQAWTTKQALTLHADHAELQTGLLWREHYFAAYDAMKKLSLVRYPWSNQGDLKIFVAGERQLQSSGQNGEAMVPYSFDVKFLESVNGIAALLDDVIRGVRDAGNTRPALETEPLRTSKPKLLHAIAPLLFFSPILLPLLPILLPWAIAAVRRRSYVLEANRVVARSGILFKKEISVLYDRIDSIQRKQGALGKFFGTGQVTLFTAGSSQPDLRLTYIPEFGAMYQDIREQYGG